MIKEVTKPSYNLFCDICNYSITDHSSLPQNWSRVLIMFNFNQRQFDCCDKCTTKGIKLPTLESIKQDMGIF